MILNVWLFLEQVIGNTFYGYNILLSIRTDSVYTERYMGMPRADDNLQGYKASRLQKAFPSPSFYEHVLFSPVLFSHRPTSDTSKINLMIICCFSLNLWLFQSAHVCGCTHTCPCKLRKVRMTLLIII